LATNLDMMPRNHRTIENNIILERSPNPNHIVPFKDPTADRNRLERM
jgi:hypothetical protein